MAFAGQAAVSGAQGCQDQAVFAVGILGQRAQRILLQHLTGTTGFRNLELAVGPGVFIPRAETELSAGLAVDAAGALVASRLACADAMPTVDELDALVSGASA